MNAMRTATVAGALGAMALLGACVEMAAIGVGAAVISVHDRRSTGTQVEDEAIELRASNRIRDRFGDRVHVNVTSYNRIVLLTGEVPDAQTREAVERIVLDLPNRPRALTNELRVGAPSSLQSRANDSFITGKVKARLVDSRQVSALHVKVVTEAAVVYLMGIVTEAEANAAVEVARTTGGVAKVVKVFEYCKPTDEICRPQASAEAGAKPAAER
jgi:osmotically-inducible protein OsmY